MRHGQDSPTSARRFIVEFRRIGRFVKVSAIDPASLVEVSIVGDPAAGEPMLERTAIRKLEYVLNRRRAARR